MQNNLLVIDNFLNSEICEDLIRDLNEQTTWRFSQVYSSNSKVSLDKPEFRRSYSISLNSEWEDELKRRIKDRIPEIDEHFNQEIYALEKIEVLKYERGHYFRPHRDDKTGKRKITGIIYLNTSGSDNENSFQGGELKLYGIIPNAPNSLGFPVQAIKGRFVLFRSELLHEVTPLIGGVRYSIVTWFL